ncbi:MAG: DNA replication/repair protein RecF [Bacilli bacterium]|nr:DNA replication/repair protein RecF [Bacilli bacterium]
MYLKNIKVNNFRNYKEESINLIPNINIIYGNNAQGKTNLLESIYFLALAKSHRSLNDKDLIKNEEEGFKVEADAILNNFPKKFEIKIANNRKIYKIDSNYIKSLNEYLSNLKIIIFFPEDLEIIKSSPDVRRRYLNIQISQLNKNYFKTLNEYNKLLKIRNDILKRNLKENYFDKQYFEIITNYLIDKASYIYCIRNKYIEKINDLIGNYYEKISTFKNLKLKYITNLNVDYYEYDNNKKLLRERFDELYQAELKSGVTLIGPQKDDIEFLLDKKNLKNYGSQGQQRMAILSLKLTEIEVFTKESDDTPILLLDDVFSELDDFKKNNLLNIIDDNIQTIITTTDLKNIDNKILEKSNLIKIENGKCITRGE